MCGHCQGVACNNAAEITFDASSEADDSSDDLPSVGVDANEIEMEELHSSKRHHSK